VRYPIDYLLAKRLSDIRIREHWEVILSKLSPEERDAIARAVYASWLDILSEPEVVR
jgi:hypothetical protein